MKAWGQIFLNFLIYDTDKSRNVKFDNPACKFCVLDLLKIFIYVENSISLSFYLISLAPLLQEVRIYQYNSASILKYREYPICSLR